MSLFNAISHASSRRTTALTVSDYDHEIGLIDHTTSRGQSVDIERSPRLEASDTSSRRYSDSQLRPKLSLREEVARKRYSKYLEPREGAIAGRRPSEGDAPLSAETTLASPGITGDATQSEADPSRSRKSTQSELETAIDVLYENQRGLFLCGMPLFSSMALGAADASPWTNIAFKASATNIKNAQVPDPSWEWVWKEWSINHTDEVDEDGWEYSFMFSKKFSWHGPTWWNSFVRRRAWIRKRIKRPISTEAQLGHDLNADYFTIHSKRGHSPSPSKSGSMQGSRNSTGNQAVEVVVEPADITDIGALMTALKHARIDREKMEAVENFIHNAGDDLYYLRERMHEIMSQFIFQASRRLLLSHLLRLVEEASAHRQEHKLESREEGPIEKQRIDNLEAAVSAADEEVKRLEYWSDIKNVAEQGETKGAVDERQGWGYEWTGVDKSGPEEVISLRQMPGVEDPKSEETVYDSGEVQPMEDNKGKGKE